MDANSKYFVNSSFPSNISFLYNVTRYVPIKESVPEEREQTRFGGNVVFCDQCNLHYCTSCSISLKEPVERHKGFSCTQRQACGNKDVAYHRLFILDEICMLRCPRCKTVRHYNLIINNCYKYILQTGF